MLINAHFKETEHQQGFISIHLYMLIRKEVANMLVATQQFSQEALIFIVYLALKTERVCLTVWIEYSAKR